jgi:hypothetical protein
LAVGKALILLALLTGLARAAEDPVGLYGVGATGSVGSRGYRKILVYADADWHLPTVDPYGWVDASADTSQRQFTFGGGVWKELEEGRRIKGGLGLAVGKYKATSETSSSATVETGFEQDLGKPTFGAEYRFTTGEIGGARYSLSNDEEVENRVRSRATRTVRAAPEPFKYHELSVYGRRKFGDLRGSLRVSLGLPSYSNSVVSETLGLTYPWGEKSDLSGSLTLEQGRASSVYFSLGLYFALN